MVYCNIYIKPKEFCNPYFAIQVLFAVPDKQKTKKDQNVSWDLKVAVV